MKISIAMCTYNGTRFLEHQLNSIAAQELQPLELIICDDGSSDTTLQIIDAFCETVLFPVHVHRNSTNLGSTKNFQKAIELCRGDLIALCDQDDYWSPDKLNTMSSVLEENPNVAGVFSNAHLIDQDGQLVQGDLWQRGTFTLTEQKNFTKLLAPYRLIARDTVTGATLLFRASYVHQLVPISAEWIHDGWIALILASVAELRPLPACPMSYRLHAAQQVGLHDTSWYSHLATRKEKALASHLQMVRRLSAMADRLEALNVSPDILRALQHRISFYVRRAQLLGFSRTRRLVGTTRLLPGYFTHANGIMSLLRDIFH